jgi:hypothetical protein
MLYPIRGNASRGKHKARGNSGCLDETLISKKRPLSADGTRLERRKSRRFDVAVPIEVSWCGPDGTPIKQDAMASQVNANGGFLKMAVYPESGARVTLANFLSAQTAEARVLAAPGPLERVANGIVVELIAPNENFWGVDLQVKKASVELQNLEHALQSEAIDPRLLAEYREAVDYIRKAAAMVSRLRECHLHGTDDGELLSILASERIRRTTHLCMEVIADLDAGRPKNETKGMDVLYQTLEHLCDRLRRVVKVEDPLTKLGFSDSTVRSLNAADQLLDDTATPFDLKSCLSHLRHFLERLHVEACPRFVRPGETAPAKWEPATAFLHNCGVISPSDEAFLTALYASVGDEAVRSRTADREYARLFRNVVVEYSLLFLATLQRQNGLGTASGRPAVTGPSLIFVSSKSRLHTDDA